MLQTKTVKKKEKGGTQTQSECGGHTYNPSTMEDHDEYQTSLNLQTSYSCIARPGLTKFLSAGSWLQIWLH